MPVDEDINLDDPEGLTEEDIRRLNEQADELERIAQSAETNAEKIKNARESMKGMNFAQLNALTGDIDEDATSGTGTVANEQSIKDMVIQVLAELEEARQERAKNAADIKEAQEQIVTMEQKFNTVRGDISGGISEFSSLTNSPFNFAKGKTFQALGKLGIYGAIANFAIQIGQQVYNETLSTVKQAFGKGGVFDIRKDVLREINQVANLQQMIQIEQGEVFFTSDTAEIIRQGVPQTSNTRERANGHKQYLQEFDR